VALHAHLTCVYASKEHMAAEATHPNADPSIHLRIDAEQAALPQDVVSYKRTWRLPIGFCFMSLMLIAGLAMAFPSQTLHVNSQSATPWPSQHAPTVALTPLLMIGNMFRPAVNPASVAPSSRSSRLKTVRVQNSNSYSQRSFRQPTMSIAIGEDKVSSADQPVETPPASADVQQDVLRRKKTKTLKDFPSTITYKRPPPGIPAKDGIVFFDFAGGGWYHAFYFGVGAAIAEFSRNRSDPAVRFGGVSAGSVVAAALAFEYDLKQCFEIAVSTFPVAAKNPFKMVQVTAESVNDNLPSDEVLRRVSEEKRLLVGISRSQISLSGPNFTAKAVYDFRDREHALAVMSASVRIPVLAGVRGKLIDGDRYWDGGITQGWDRLPMFDDVSEDKDSIIRIVLHHEEDWSGLKEGWITPGMDLPAAWSIIPHSEDALRLLFRLGYLRTIEYLGSFGHESKLHRKFHEVDADRFAESREELRVVMHELGLVAQESPTVSERVQGLRDKIATRAGLKLVDSDRYWDEGGSTSESDRSETENSS